MKKIIPYVSILFLLLCLSVTVPAATNTTKTTIITLTEKAEGKVYLSWSKKTVDGYQVRWAPNSKMTGAKSASFTETEMYRSGLIGGRTYYFQVRTYKKINGKKVYSNWSPMRSIKLKKLPPTTTITSLIANSSSSFTVKWNKKSGVKGYQIRYSTDSSFKTKKTASTLKNIHTRKDLAKGTYYVSVRSYNVAADGTKYYSNWSGMKSVTLQEDLQKIFEKASGKYGYMHIAGNWGYSMDIDKQGFITGQDSSYGAFRDYTGRFNVVKQINKYTYEMKIRDLKETARYKLMPSATIWFNDISKMAEVGSYYLFVPGTPRNVILSLCGDVFSPQGLKDGFYNNKYCIGYKNSGSLYMHGFYDCE